MRVWRKGRGKNDGSTVPFNTLRVIHLEGFMTAAALSYGPLSVTTSSLNVWGTRDNSVGGDPSALASSAFLSALKISW
jgi:hypothetical protein